MNTVQFVSNIVKIFILLFEMVKNHYHFCENIYCSFKQLMFTLVFWFTIQVTCAQRTEIDSLQNLVTISSGKAQVDALNELAFKLIIIDYKKASQHLDRAESLARKINYAKGLSEAIIIKGVCESLAGNTEQALQTLSLGHDRAKQINNRGWQGYALVQIGNIFREQGRYDSAKYWYDQSRIVLKDSLNPWHLSMLYRNLSRYYAFTSKPREELQYLKRSLAIREKLSDKILLVDVLVLLSKWYLNQSDLEKASEYLARAEQYVDPELESEIQKDVKYQRAFILFKKYRFQEALSILEDVKNFYLANGNLQQYVKLLLDLAELLEKNDSYDISLKNGFEALKISEEKNFIIEKVRAQLIIGRNYYRIEQAASAHEFIDEALSIAKKNGFKNYEGSAYNMNGLLLQQENKNKEALQSFENALLIRTQLENKQDVGSTLNNMGEIFESLGLLQKALQLQKQSLEISDEILDTYGTCWATLGIGSIYTKMNDLENAKYYLDSAERTAKSIHAAYILVYVYREKRLLLLASGQLNEALDYSFLYEKIKDSVISTNITNRILALKSVYELERKDQEIQLLNKSKQVQEDKIIIQKNRIQRQLFFIIASVVGIILLSALAYTLYRYFKKMSRLNEEVQERNEEIQAQSEEMTETNNSLILLNMELAEKQEAMAVQSEEISEANSQFVHLNSELAEKQKELETQAEELRESNNIVSELNENLEQKVRERTRDMQQAYKELDTFFYRSSHDFRRPLTTFMGLSEVAKITVKDTNALNLFEKVKETAVNLDRMLIKLQSISDVGAHQFVYKEVSMQAVFESARDVYREAIDQFGIRVSISVANISTFLSYPAFLKIIVENLVENAIQFRGRSEPFIMMQAIEKYGGVEITIQDNGQGVEEEYQEKLFDMFFRGSEQSKGNGLGLYIVKKAVGKLRGTLHLESTFEKGTAVSIWIPVKQTNSEM